MSGITRWCRRTHSSDSSDSSSSEDSRHYTKRFGAHNPRIEQSSLIGKIDLSALPLPSNQSTAQKLQEEREYMEKVLANRGSNKVNKVNKGEKAERVAHAALPGNKPKPADISARLMHVNAITARAEQPKTKPNRGIASDFFPSARPSAPARSSPRSPKGDPSRLRGCPVPPDWFNRPEVSRLSDSGGKTSPRVPFRGSLPPPKHLPRGVLDDNTPLQSPTHRQSPVANESKGPLERIKSFFSKDSI